MRALGARVRFLASLPRADQPKKAATLGSRCSCSAPHGGHGPRGRPTTSSLKRLPQRDHTTWRSKPLRR
eukprot:7386609-Prymnesium_polylepis.1